MSYPLHNTPEFIARVSEENPVGSRVELTSMDDPYTKLSPGDQGTVVAVDSIGTVFVRWDSGSGLGLVPGVDSWLNL